MNRPAYLPPSLTDEQLRAILHTGSPLLIVAGPGSGKTAVMTWRVTYLIESGRAAPPECLVTTFAKKASFELKDRIERNLVAAKLGQAAVAAEQMQVCTLHSFCADLLRSYQSVSPLPRGYRILDETGQLLFIYSNRAKLGLGELLKGRTAEFYADVLRMFNLATEELVEPERLLDWCRTQQAQARERAVQAAAGKSKVKAQRAVDEVSRWEAEAIITEAYRSYCSLLQESNLVDFGHLQSYALKLLESHPDIKTEVRTQWKEILVDEYQDTNAVQELVLKQLADKGTRLSVVGDDDQSIYRFRGATVKNMSSFPKLYPGTCTVTLTHNFRSRSPIVKQSIDVIEHNTWRLDKDLVPVRGPGSDVLLVYEHSIAEEAAAIARLLRRLRDDGRIRQWSDVVLLLRSVRSYGADYLEALQTEGVPAFVVGDAKLFERWDVQDLCGLFHFMGATKPWGDVRVRCRLMDWRDSTAAALEKHKEDLLDLDGDAAVEAIGVADLDDRKRLIRLLELKRRVLAKKHRSLLQVFYETLAITGYVGRCERAGELEALMNLGVVSQLIAAFDAYGNTRNLYPFLDYVRLMQEMGVDPAVDAPPDAVRVTTIHQVKGLEFPVVVLASAVTGRLPTRLRGDRYLIPAELRASGAPEVTPEEERHVQDERKLFYVAGTRARELLVVGTANVIAKRGGGPSPFVTEMFGDNLHRAADLSQARIVEAESAPTTDAAPRDRVSFSELAYFLQCPMRYKLAHCYGLESTSPDPLDFGANVHRALRVVHERARAGRVSTEADVAVIVDQTWIPASKATAAADRRVKRAAITQLRRYVSRHAGSLKQVERAECGFSFALEDRVLTGKIDLIRRTGDGCEVVDFKTGVSTLSGREQVETQLDLYALGAQTNMGLPVVGHSVHYLGDDRTEPHEWSKAKADSARSRLRGIVRSIAQGDFAPRVEFCRRCDEFGAVCPYAR